MLELFLGQIPEAIFFALFLIFAKNIKEKRIIFIILMIIEYLLLIYTFQYNWFFHIGFMITTFLTLKILYKEKSQITDIFILLIGYLFLGATSIICCLLFNFNMIIVSIINRFLIFILLFVFKNKLQNIQKIYKILWNRNDKNNKKLKSTTFRAINIVLFNVAFYIINLFMLYAIFLKEMG